MGLAPYGEPVHFERIMKEMVHLNEDGSFKLNMKYFAYDHGLRMTNGGLRRASSAARRASPRPG